MNRDATLLIVLVVVVIVVLGVIGLGAFGTTRTISTSGPGVAFDAPPSDGSAGVVFDLHEESGQSIFGITFTSAKYKATVGVVAPDECLSQDESGQDVLSTEGECADLPVHGEVTGGGTTVDGGRLTIVSVDISKNCFEVLQVGDAWPPPEGACAP